MRVSTSILRRTASIRSSARLTRRPGAAAQTARLSTAVDPSSSRSTINQDEIAHFSKLSALWWDERGEFQMLHRMNPIRTKFIREKMVSGLDYFLV